MGRAARAAAHCGPRFPVNAPPTGGTDAPPSPGGASAPQPTWRQMTRTTPAWVWAIGCGGLLSICAMFFVIMLLAFTAK